jgi:hypothetical protein
VLDSLDSVKPKADGGWTAPCLAHDDRENSLSIAQAGDGRVLLHCFAGCETIRDVVTKLGFRPSDLFVKRVPRFRPGESPTEPDGPLTIERLAVFFKVDPRRLLMIGVENTEEGVAIRYHEVDGTLL